MLKKSLLFGFMMLCLSITSMAQGSGMTDQQVMEYAQAGLKEGKSQQQIATELARRGVTREQAERVKKLYEESLKNEDAIIKDEIDRQRTNVKETTAAASDIIPSNFTFANIQETQTSSADQVFGRNIFNSQNLTFEPSTNLPTPPNYRLGAGDVVIDGAGDADHIDAVFTQRTGATERAIATDSNYAVKTKEFAGGHCFALTFFGHKFLATSSIEDGTAPVDDMADVFLVQANNIAMNQTVPATANAVNLNAVI